MNIDLQLDRISKRYRIRHEDKDADRARGFSAWRSRQTEFWAVRDISFEVPSGQALGIIGHNGAGKSTVLKLLAGVTSPTSGEITIRGRISALLEVGSGFHPELTGRENVFLSGSILGMKRAEIRSKFDDIVDFADVEEFIDVPVKRFSSGMIVRLAFAVAAHLNPDILLLDEVLAVGDSVFQKKCIERVLTLKHRTTIVFISHDLSAVQQLCDRVLVMSGGKVVHDSTPEEAIPTYHSLTRFRSSSRAEPRNGAAVAEITSVDFLDGDGGNVLYARTGDPLRVRVHFKAVTPVRNCGVVVMLHGPEGDVECEFSTRSSPFPLELEPGSGMVEFFCESLSLLPGSYLIDAVIEDEGHLTLDWQYRCSVLQVNAGKAVKGLFYQPHSWKLLDP
jgi:ABC-type polysaccharide/polyol phosphate transport system ATPase subunit